MVVAAPPERGGQVPYVPCPGEVHTLPLVVGPPTAAIKIPNAADPPMEHGETTTTAYGTRLVSRSDERRAGPRTPRPPVVPAPSSDPGGGVFGGGTQQPTGIGAVPCKVPRPPALWSITKEPAHRADRNISDKPSFSPD